MLFQLGFAALIIAAPGAFSSPISDQDIVGRNLSPAACSAVVTIVEVLKLNKATPFCSSFLDIKIQMSTAVTTSTSVKTVTTGTTSTTTVFEPGQPPPLSSPAARLRREFDIAERVPSDTVPSWASAFATSALSSGCQCLNLPTPTTATTSTSIVVSTTDVSPPVSTTTVYPCATPIAGYGLSSGSSNIEATQNDLYGQGTNGTTLEGCCNLCYFGVPNCIQAWYYFYEGCVIQQGTTVTGTGIGVSSVCPNGAIGGLTYGPDSNPPFRSTGDIAGPCGQSYTNF